MDILVTVNIFSSALCYCTAELPTVVTRASVRPSVKPVFSEHVKHINAKFGGKGTFSPYHQTIIIQNLAFLALLCATAQQSYCRHAGVRRPSVKPVFSEPVKQINAKFGTKVPFHDNVTGVTLCVGDNRL